MAGDPGQPHNVRAHDAQDVFDWLDPLSLGIMSASAYIESVALNPTCKINYQELARSI